MFSQSETHSNNTAARTQLQLDCCTPLGARHLSQDTLPLITGSITSNYSWVYSRKKLEIFSKLDGCLVALYTPLHSSDFIRHVSEYRMTSHSEPVHKYLFLISTSRSTHGPHLLLVFNPEVSRVVKAIQIPFPVFSICPLYPQTPSQNEENEVESVWPLSEVSCGLVAVGGGAGIVLLVDLRLDDEDEIFGENTPSATTTYRIDITEKAILQRTRQECIADQSHPSHILPGMTLPVGNAFIFRCREEGDSSNHQSSEVVVTCLAHLSSLRILTVGYNFGAFQLYDVVSLELLFSSDVDNLPSPVLHVLYHEPEDDPRDFVYVWLVRGCAAHLGEDYLSYSSLSLYQLLFHSSRSVCTQVGDMQVLQKRYFRFLDAGLKFQHFLSSSPYARQLALSKDTLLISSGIFPQYRRVQERVWSPESLAPPSFPRVSHTNDLTLAYFIYRTSPSGEQPQGGYRLSLFDLNLWYNSQMNSCITPTSKFYHVYDLDSTLALLSAACHPPLPLEQLSFMDMRLTSVQKFDMTPPIPEAFLLPSSLSLRFDSLSRSHLLNFSLIGDQERVLSQTAATLSAGYTDNIESVCVELVRTGVLSPASYSSTPGDKTESWEDSILLLLNASLRHGRLEAINSCVSNSHNMSGDIPLSLISRWALSKFEELKDNLLSQSNLLLEDPRDISLTSSIKSLLSTLHYLSILISRIPTAHLSTGSYPEHRPHLCKKSIELLTLYHEALLWMTSLPSQLLASYQHNKMLSHYRKLRDFHQSPLLIDQMLAQLNPAVFDKWTSSAPGSQHQEGVYPPPNPLCVLEPLLDPSLPEVSQSILLYFLIDLSMQYEEQSSPPLTSSFISSCPQVHKRLPSLSYSFWLIDNAHFKSGVTELLSVPNSTLQLFPFAVTTLLEFLLKSDQCHLVSLILSVHKPILDTLALFQLYLQALVKSGNIFHALKQLYNFFPIGSTHECLSELLESFDLPALKKLVHTPLDSMVLSQIVEFLQNKDTFIHSEILIMILLKQNKIVRGVQTYHEIKSAMLTQARSEKEKMRLSLLDQLIQAFEKVAACDLEHIARPPLGHRAPKREVSVPTPLSTKIRRHNLDSAAAQKQLLSSLNEKVIELQQAKFNFEEVNMLPPTHLAHATRHKYKRLSELTYPSPTNSIATSQQLSDSYRRGTPLKLAMNRFLNKNSPYRSIPSPSLIRLNRAPPTPPSAFTAFSHLAATPSSILKQITTHTDGLDLSPVNLNFSLSETDFSHKRMTRFDVPSSPAENDLEEAHHSPLSSLRETGSSPPDTGSSLPTVVSEPEEPASPLLAQIYFSPIQHPEQLKSTEQIEIVSLPPIQTEDVSATPSPVQSSQVDHISIATELSDRNAISESGQVAGQSEEDREPDERAASETTEGTPAQLELRFDTDMEEKKETTSSQLLKVSGLVKMIPEMEGLERSNSNLYPLNKYTPFSVEDERNKIFASIQLGHSPFSMTGSSLPSHKETLLSLRSVATTTASYILSDTHSVPIVSTPIAKSNSSRHKSFQPTPTPITQPETKTPLRVPQHQYYTRAKTPATPKVEMRDSPINFLHTVPAEKQTKPPKVTLFNKGGNLRRSQRLKDRSLN